MTTSQEKRHAVVQGAQEYMEFFFSLIAIFVIPALFFSSVILAASVTGYINEQQPVGSVLVWIGGIILTISIEAASIGSFNLARQMRTHRQGRRAIWVCIMGIVLTSLVIVTLAFAAFHITGELDNILKAVRIAAAVLYALVAHSHGSGHGEITQEQQDKITTLFEQFQHEQANALEAHTCKLQEMSERTEQRIRSLEAYITERLQGQQELATILFDQFR